MMAKRYGVDFYDMIDGWIRWPELDPEMQFDELEKSKDVCSLKQLTLPAANIRAGEHYGVIDLERGIEVYCGLNENHAREKLLESLASFKDATEQASAAMASVSKSVSTFDELMVELRRDWRFRFWYYVQAPFFWLELQIIRLRGWWKKRMRNE